MMIKNRKEIKDLLNDSEIGLRGHGLEEDFLGHITKEDIKHIRDQYELIAGKELFYPSYLKVGTDNGTVFIALYRVSAPFIVIACRWGKMMSCHMCTKETSYIKITKIVKHKVYVEYKDFRKGDDK